MSIRGYLALPVVALVATLTACGGGGGGGSAGIGAPPPIATPTASGTYSATVAPIPGSNPANLVAVSPVYQSAPGLNLSAVTFQTPNGGGVLGVIDPSRNFGWVAPWPAVSNGTLASRTSRVAGVAASHHLLSSSTVSIDAQTTAVTLVWLYPGIFSVSHESQIVAAIQNLPAVAALASALQSNATSMANPLTAPSVVSAYQQAVQAAVSALGPLTIQATHHGRPASLRSARGPRSVRPLQSSSACDTIDASDTGSVTVTPLTCSPGSSATSLAITSGTATPQWNSSFVGGVGGTGEGLPYVGVAYQINPACYSSGAQFDQLITNNPFASTPPSAPGQCQPYLQNAVQDYLTLDNNGAPVPGGSVYLPPTYGELQYLDVVGDAIGYIANSVGQAPQGTSFTLGSGPAVYDVSLYTCAPLTQFDPAVGQVGEQLAANGWGLLGTWDSGYNETVPILSSLAPTPPWVAVASSCVTAVDAVALAWLGASHASSGASSLASDEQNCVNSQIVGLTNTIISDSASQSSFVQDLLNGVVSLATCITTAVGQHSSNALLSKFAGGVGSLFQGLTNIQAYGETADIVASTAALLPWEGYVVQVGNPWPSPSPTSSPSPSPTPSSSPSPNNPWLYVTRDGAPYAVLAFDEKGNQQPLSGAFPGLGQPDGITFDPHNGWLYVAVPYPCCSIGVYDEQGHLQQTSGVFPNLANYPVSIAYDSHNNFLYVDTGHGVQAYDEQGNQQSLLGTFPLVYGSQAITYDSHNGLLYVTLAAVPSGGVAAYNEQGFPQGISGTFPNLVSPSGIAYDPHDGLLYVADYGSGSVKAYDEQGNQQTLSGTFPNLSAPYGIGYDPHNQFLYVVDIVSPVPTLTAYDEQGNEMLSFPTGGTNGVAVVP